MALNSKEIDIMAEIEIPFSEEFKKQLINDEKTMTSRTKRYGESGDTFSIFGETFVLQHVFKETLEQVAEKYYKEEGFASSKDFIEIWIRLHPMKGFIPDKKVFVHEFNRS